MHQIHIHRRNDHHRRDSVASEGGGASGGGDGAGSAAAAAAGGAVAAASTYAGGMGKAKASRSRLFESNLLVSWSAVLILLFRLLSPPRLPRRSGRG